MRITVGETPDAQSYRCILDGVDISNDCVAADSDEGWAECLVFLSDGRLMVDASGEPRRETRRGVVSLVKK